MEENEFTPVVYDPNARISLWFFKIFGFGVYRVLELNSSNIQKCLQRIFATLYFVRSFFDDLFLQQFILRQFFLIAKINSQKKSAQKIFAYLFLHYFFCIFIFAYLIKMTI